MVRVIVVIFMGGNQSQPSLPLDGFGLDFDRSWLEFDKKAQQVGGSLIIIKFPITKLNFFDFKVQSRNNFQMWL